MWKLNVLKVYRKSKTSAIFLKFNNKLTRNRSLQLEYFIAKSNALTYITSGRYTACLVQFSYYFDTIFDIIQVYCRSTLRLQSTTFSIRTQIFVNRWHTTFVSVNSLGKHLNVRSEDIASQLRFSLWEILLDQISV